MNDEQVKHMVDRFLGWRLPDNFSPDGGITFKATINEGTPYQHTFAPSGTNVFNARQAEAMVRHMLEGLPVSVTAAAEGAVGRAVYARVSELIAADSPELAELDLLANIVVAAEASALQPQPQE